MSQEMTIERIRLASLSFSETVSDQRDDRVQRFEFVGAVGFEQHSAPLARHQHHHAHQTLGVDFAAAARQRHVALIFRGQLRESGGSGGVQAQLVNDLNFALLHKSDPF